MRQDRSPTSMSLELLRLGIVALIYKYGILNFVCKGVNGKRGAQSWLRDALSGQIAWFTISFFIHF